jgi:hypothetical protein
MNHGRDIRFQKSAFQLGRLILLLLALSFMFVASDQASAGDGVSSSPGCTIASRLQCHPAGIAAITFSPSLKGEIPVQAKTCSCCKGSTCVCQDEEICEEQGDECQGACKPVKKPKTR